jgi:hypothetical protein
MQGPRWSGETLACAGQFAVVAAARWVQRFWQVSIASSSVMVALQLIGVSAMLAALKDGAKRPKSFARWFNLKPRSL